MPTRKDPFLVRSSLLPDNTQYSIPQLAECLELSRVNVKELLFARVAEHLYDPHGDAPHLVFASTNRNLGEGEADQLVDLLVALETAEAIREDLMFEEERAVPQLDVIERLRGDLERANAIVGELKERYPSLPHEATAIAKKLEGRPTLSQQGLDVLQSVEPAPTDQLAVNVRVRAGRRLLSPLDSEERPYIGWNREFSDEEADLATSRWWPELTRHDVVGLPFVVTLSGFVVRCGRIQRRLRHDGGRIGFEVDWSDEAVNRDWFGKRAPTKQGAIIGFLND